MANEQYIIGPGQTDATTNGTGGASESLIHVTGSQTMTVEDFSALEEFVNFTILETASPTYPASVPLKIALTGAFETYANGGLVYLHADNSGAGSATNTIAATQLLGASSLFLAGSGAFTSVHQRSGYLEVGASTTGTNVYRTGGRMKVRHSTAQYTNFYSLGGSCDLERDVTGTIFVGGGQLRVYRENQSGNTASPDWPTAGTIWVAKGAELLWQSGGNITTLNAFAPIDLSHVTDAFTLTNLNITAEAYENSVLESKNPAVSITISNTTELVGHSARM
jgi:hypothetical protein